jgi:hypothetical protein
MIVNGKVVIEGASLPEGERVTVLSRGANQPFSLSHEDEDALLAAMAEIDRGESVSLEDLLATLPK